MLGRHAGGSVPRNGGDVCLSIRLLTQRLSQERYFNGKVDFLNEAVRGLLFVVVT